MKRLNFGFLTLALAIIFAIVFTACGAAGLEELEDLLGRTGGTDDKYEVGQRGHGGGVVFYVDEEGFEVDGETYYYLEAAPNNLGNAQWGASGEEISGITDTLNHPVFYSYEDFIKYFVGKGKMDTLAIVEYFEDFPEAQPRAAQIAANADFGGLNDWYLPNAIELDLLHQQKDLEGIKIASGRYWSSSQGNSRFVVYKDFSYSVFYGNTDFSVIAKTNSYRVHPIRAFR